MAEAFANHECDGLFNACSAGLEPEKLHPLAVHVMRGPNGERFGPVNSEVEQRANYYAWAALMKGDSHVTVPFPCNGVRVAVD